MTTSYGRSALGYLWAILQPVAGVAVLSLVFSVLLQAPPIGKSFVLFYATGLLPFLAYSDLQAKLSATIPFSKALLRYPCVTILDAVVARFILNGLVQGLVAFLLFLACLTLTQTHAVLDLAQVALGFAMLAVFAAGVGVLTAALAGLFEEWSRVWWVLNRPLFIISGVFFLYESVPAPYQGYLWYNPLVHVVGQVRAGFYPFYDAQYISPTYVFLVGMSCLALGLGLLRRYGDFIVYER